MTEMEKGKSSEGSRASTRVDRARGSAPVLISITLTAETYIAPPGTKCRTWPPLQNVCNPFSQRCGIFDSLIRRADVSRLQARC